MSDFTISLFGAELVFDLFDANTLAARDFAASAAASATAAADLLGSAQGAIGHWVEVAPTITNGFFNKNTGAFTSNANYRAYELTRGIESKLRIRILLNGAATSAVSFFDDGGTIVGLPIESGADGSFLYHDALEVEWPAGAVTAKGSAWNNPEDVDDIQRPGGLFVQRLIVDDARANDVSEALASQPFVLQAWSPTSGRYWFRNGLRYSASGWREQVFEIAEGQSIIVDNATKNGGTTGIVFGHTYDASAGTLAEVTGFFEDHSGAEQAIRPIARTAPPRTTHVAVTSFGDRAVRVWISEPSSNVRRSESRTMAVLNPLMGKTAVLFGTSIPAGGGITASHYDGIKEDLGLASLVNEAIGGSAARWGVAARRSSSDPFGVSGAYWGNLFVCMGKSLADCDTFISEWGSKYRALVQGDGGTDFKPSAPLSTEYQNQIRNSSYETILDRHLGDGNRKDYYIFDHGYNDWSLAFFSQVGGTASFLEDMDDVPAVESWYDPPSLANGASATTTVSVPGSVVGQAVSVEFGQPKPAGYTVTAAVTSAGTVTVTFTNSSGGTVNLAAGALVVNRFDMATFIGAMEFYFNRIWLDNPRARIVLIGHFENQRTTNIQDGQEALAARNLLPLCKTWEATGWSQRRILGGANDAKTMFEIALPDGIHPFSDTTGKSRDILRGIIARWLAGNA